MSFVEVKCQIPILDIYDNDLRKTSWRKKRMKRKDGREVKGINGVYIIIVSEEEEKGECLRTQEDQDRNCER